MSAGGGDAVVRCSFCGKSQHDVRTLIAGPNVHICDECIDVCSETLERDVPCAPRGEEPIPPIASCAFCRLQKDASELRMVQDGGILCVTCIDAVRSLIEASI